MTISRSNETIKEYRARQRKTYRKIVKIMTNFNQLNLVQIIENQFQTQFNTQFKKRTRKSNAKSNRILRNKSISQLFTTNLVSQNSTNKNK